MSRIASQFVNRQRKIIYGPVISRRLGASIGINLFPGKQKVCSLNCVYCFLNQVGSEDGYDFLDLENIDSELTIFFNNNGGNSLKKNARFLTFSGNGEPTLHPNFANIVRKVREWRDKEANNLKLAIFTNGTRLHTPEIQETLLLFDKVYLKFDWSSDEELNSISRPTSPINYNYFIEHYQRFIEKTRRNDILCNVILHTAMYHNNRKEDDWKRWADAVKTINPTELQLYELDYKGTDFEPDESFDFHEFQRNIHQLFPSENYVPDLFYSSPFYVNLDLCYSVDSLIYLPLYIADYDKLFEDQEVKVNTFVSQDGDLGAVDSIISGKAQFAICDPQAVTESLARIPKDRLDPENEPMLVAVLIKSLALWTLCEGSSETCCSATPPRNAINQCSKVITYESGSTASYIWEWQKRMRPNEYNSKGLIPVKPGEEIRKFCQSCSNDEKPCVITADILSAKLCCIDCSERELWISSYADRNIGKEFLFTGLLASRSVIEKYPGAVNGVVKGLRTAIKRFYDPAYMAKNRSHLIDYIADIFTYRNPPRLDSCSLNKLISAISLSIQEIMDLKIYSESGQITSKQLLNAYRIRLPEVKKTGANSFLRVCSPINVPYSNAKSKIFFNLLRPFLYCWSWIGKFRAALKVSLIVSLLVVTGYTYKLATMEEPFLPTLMMTICVVTGGITASVVIMYALSFLLSISNKKIEGL